MSDAPTVPMKDGLLPCPFCGGGPYVSTFMTESLWSHDQVTYTKVECGECDVGFATEPGHEVQAQAAWNTRAPLGGMGGGEDQGSFSPKSENTQPGASLTVLVPREPTREMLEAALDCPISASGNQARAVWSAMIAATQQATGDGGLRREIERLKAALIEAQTLDKGFYDWLVERDLIDTGGEIEWPDIVTALTEHEIEMERSATQQAVSPAEGVE